MQQEPLERQASESWIDSIEFTVAVLTQLSILAIAISSLLNRQWLTAFSGSVVFLLTFAPPIMERQLHVRLPVEISFFTCVFLFASYVLGETRDFYERVWWWDLSLGLNMQRSGLTDTMTDLIVNAGGALAAAAVGYYYVRHDDELFGRKLICALVERGRRG